MFNKTRRGLCDRFVPYFCVHHKTKGELLGPFAKLRALQSTRRLILDSLSTLMADDGEHKELVTSIQKCVSVTDDMNYWSAIKSWNARAA